MLVSVHCPAAIWTAALFFREAQRDVRHLSKAVVAADLLLPGENSRASTPPIRPGLVEQSDGPSDLAHCHRTAIDLAVLLRVAQQRKDEIKNLLPIRCFGLFSSAWRHLAAKPSAA
jgi:hypothetical protein